jgi:hypothetical protein
MDSTGRSELTAAAATSAWPSIWSAPINLRYQIARELCRSALNGHAKLRWYVYVRGFTSFQVREAGPLHRCKSSWHGIYKLGSKDVCTESLVRGPMPS